jgi:hypothetical protein
LRFSPVFVFSREFSATMLRTPDARKRMTNILMAWTVIAVMFTLCDLMLQPSHGGVDEHASFMDETNFVSPPRRPILTIM